MINPEETDAYDELITTPNFEDVEDETDDDDSDCGSDIGETAEDESVCNDTESVNNE